MKHLKKTLILVFLIALSAHGQEKQEYVSEEKLREHQAKEVVRRDGVSICYRHGAGSIERDYRLFVDMLYMRHISYYAGETLKKIAQTRNESERFSLERKFQNYHLEINALTTVYESHARVECSGHDLVHPMTMDDYVDYLEAMAKAQIPLPQEKK